jgi:hypothetical protein
MCRLAQDCSTGLLSCVCLRPAARGLFSLPRPLLDSRVHAFVVACVSSTWPMPVP